MSLDLRERLARGEAVTFRRTLDRRRVGCLALAWIAAGFALLFGAPSVLDAARGLVSDVTPEPVVLITSAALWFCGVAGLCLGPPLWAARRYGRCTIAGDELTFGDDAAAGLWRVHRGDVTGWRITPHGVHVECTRVTGSTLGPGPQTALERLLAPYLIPTRDEAEAAAVADHLAARPRG